MNVIAEVSASAHNFSPKLVTQTSTLNNDKSIICGDNGDNNNNNDDDDIILRSSSSGSYPFSSTSSILPPPQTLLNYYSSSHNGNLIDCNIFSDFVEFVENNNYDNELFTIPIDELAKAATITKKSSSLIMPLGEINRKSKLNCFTASDIGCASSPSATLPDDVSANKKSDYHNNNNDSENNKIFRSYKGSKSLKNNDPVVNIFPKFKKSKFNSTTMNNNNNNVSQKATTAKTRTKNKFTQANIHQKITILLAYYPPRFLILFLLGSLTSFVVDHLLTQNNITEYPKDITKLIDTAAWIPPTCGFSAVLIGSLFPLADYLLMCKPKEFQREWSSVMRCIGGFMGVAYAATKLHWSSNYQVSCTLTLISMVLWFLFDRTRHGFIMSTLFSSIGTIVMYLLVSNGIYSFTHADFFGVRSWIPCILYSSCICFGAVGRRLMIVPEEWFEDDTNVITSNNTFNNDVNNGIGNNINSKSRSKKY